MATTGSGKKTPRGKARLALEESEKAVSVELDRPGFRRLLETLQQLAETGQPQTFEKSGRGRNGDLRQLIFHIEGAK